MRWWLLLGVLLFLLFRTMLPDTLGEQARQSIESKLSAHYPMLDLRIRSGRFVPGEGLVLQDIVVAAPQADGRQLPVVTVARVVAETKFDWSLAGDGEFPMTASRMIVSGLEANVWSDEFGKFSIEHLLPFPKLGPGCPKITIRDARVRLMHDPSEPAQSVEWTDVNLQITKTSAPSAGAATYHVHGVAHSSHCDRLELTAEGGPDGWQIKGVAQNVSLDHTRLARLPTRFNAAAKGLDGLNCVGDATFSANLPRDVAPKWKLQFDVRDGQFRHPRISLATQQIRGRVMLGHDGARFEAVHARVDGAHCLLDGTLDKLSWPSPLKLHIEATDLLLDGRLADALPTEMRTKWDRLQPAGRVDIVADVSCKSEQWRTSATVRAKGVNVQFDRFPYPVRNMNGTVQFDEGFIWSKELYGTVDGKPMRCELRLSPPGSGQPQWFKASVDGTITLDETLMNALTPRNQLQSKLETFVRSLSPAGGIRLASAEFHLDPNGNKSQRFDIRVEDAQLRYDRFPYPLYGVDGQILVKDNTTRLVNFVARNGDAASIRCDGTFRNQSAGGELELDFVGKSVPLDRTLRAALPTEETRRTWDALAPTGVLDHLEVKLTKSPTEPTPRLQLAASMASENGVSQNTVSVRPTALPYRMDIVTGKVAFSEGIVRIEQIDGRHDSSRLAANGTCTQASDGRWVLDMNILSGSRLTLDAELASCLPPEVQGVCQRLQLRGPLGVRGQTSLLLPDDVNPQSEMRFDLSVQLEGNRLGDVGAVRDVRGELTLRGQQNVDGVTADGTVQLDSLHFQDIQLTGVHGPFAIRGSQLYLGARNAALEPDEDFQPIAGKVFGGQFTLAGSVAMATSQYDVFVSLVAADVPTMLSDFHQPQSGMTGKISGEVRLEGAIGAMHLLKGGGQASLSGANLYQMPQIVQLLTQLRVTPDEDAAFRDGTATFTISGDQIAFSQLQLWGELIALHGVGTVSRLKDLDLRFNTRVSPQNTWSRLIRPLSSQQYTLWTIDVSGPIDSPTIERRALDSVSETLERLFPGMSREALQATPAIPGKVR